MGFFGKLFGSEEQKGKAATMGPSTMKESKGAKTVKDPVCGMNVDPETAPAKSEYMGKTYYFCSAGCKKAFDANPAKYVGGAGHEMAGHGGHKM